MRDAAMRDAIDTATPAYHVRLWQLELSHFNEKVRWALDHKRINHRRRSLLPGAHVLITHRLTGEVDTTPVLDLDGRMIGDSTRIIAALEERWPDPPLYPQDPMQRRRALELEDFFDEQLGAHIRRAIYEVLLKRPDILVPLFTRGQPPVARGLFAAGFPILIRAMRRVLNINAAAAARSRAATVAAMDRLESELQPNGYLVGDGFSVADLTAASLFYPVVQPPEFPYPLVAEVPEPGREFIAVLAERPGGRWVADMYARHRVAAGVTRRCL
jgi:glutathione S-transferase